MRQGLEFEGEAARRLEAVYATPDVVGQRCEVLRALELGSGERVLDIGAGPGFLAFDMALTVGPSGRVRGIDISEGMLALSKARCADHPWVEFQSADATRLPFPDGDFDVAVSTQVYEYVAEITTALAELHRVLRPGGRALILDTDWDSIVWHSSDRERMNRVLEAWDEHLVDPYLPRTLAPKLKQAGFAVRRRDVIPLVNPELHVNTYSHGMMGLIASYVAGRRGVTREEAEAWAADLQALGKAGEYFFSLNRYLFLAVKPDTHAAV